MLLEISIHYHETKIPDSPVVGSFVTRGREFSDPWEWFCKDGRELSFRVNQMAENHSDLRVVNKIPNVILRGFARQPEVTFLEIKHEGGVIERYRPLYDLEIPEGVRKYMK